MHRSTRNRQSEEELLVEWLAEDNHYALIYGKRTNQILKVMEDKGLGTRTNRTIVDKVRRLEKQHAAAVAFLRENDHSIDDVLMGEVCVNVEKKVRVLFPYYQHLMAVFQAEKESKLSQRSPVVTDEEDPVRPIGTKKKRSDSQQSCSKRICGENDNTVATRTSVMTGIVSHTRIYETSGWMNRSQLLGETLKDLPESCKKKMNNNVVKFQQQENESILQNQREMQQINLLLVKARARLDLQSVGMSKEEAERAIPM